MDANLRTWIASRCARAAPESVGLLAHADFHAHVDAGDKQQRLAALEAEWDY